MSRVRAGAVVREVLFVLLPATIGYAVAGLTGALVAAAAVVAGRLPSDAPGRAVSMAAFVLLIGAALATVLEADIGGPISLAFPLQRELAADLAAAAGILLLAAVVTSAAAERAAEPSWQAPGPVGPAAAGPAVGSAVGWREAAVLLGALLVRAAGAPDLAAGFDPAVVLLQNGEGMRVQGEALLAPMAPVASAYGPGGPWAVLVVAGTATVGGVLVLARRLAPPGTDPVRGALVAGVLAAALPSMWLLALPEALAAAAGVAAVVLAQPGRLTSGRAVAAGVAAGVAALARPDALVVLPVLVAWALVGGRRRRRPSRRAVRSAWSLVGGAALVVVPWGLWAHGETGSWLPAETFGPGSVRPALWLVVLAGLSAAATAAAAVAALRTFRSSLLALLPLLALPVWCAAMTLVEGFGHGAPLSWGAPFVTVLAGWQVAVWAGAGRRAAHPDAARSSS